MLREALLSGTRLAEPGLREPLLSPPRLFLARSRSLAPALPTRSELSRLVLTLPLTGHTALSWT
jgi:hypothetical protein